MPSREIYERLHLIKKEEKEGRLEYPPYRRKE